MFEVSLIRSIRGIVTVASQLSLILRASWKPAAESRRRFRMVADIYLRACHVGFAASIFRSLTMTISDELERLDNLRVTGVLSEHEFQQAKQRLLAGNSGVDGLTGQPGRVCGMHEQTWCMLMHLSQLLLFAGGIGIVAPIIMWAISKDDSDLARRHGARMMNWLISSFIYVVISGILLLVFIGIPLLLMMVLLNVVFPVMAALKANDGVLWSYPMAIRFLPED